MANALKFQRGNAVKITGKSRRAGLAGEVVKAPLMAGGKYLVHVSGVSMGASVDFKEWFFESQLKLLEVA